MNSLLRWIDNVREARSTNAMALEVIHELIERNVKMQGALDQAYRSNLSQQRVTLKVFELLRDTTADDIMREWAIDKIREYEDDIALISEHTV